MVVSLCALVLTQVWENSTWLVCRCFENKNGFLSPRPTFLEFQFVLGAPTRTITRWSLFRQFPYYFITTHSPFMVALYHFILLTLSPRKWWLLGTYFKKRISCNYSPLLKGYLMETVPLQLSCLQRWLYLLAGCHSENAGNACILLVKFGKRHTCRASLVLYFITWKWACWLSCCIQMKSESRQLGCMVTVLHCLLVRRHHFTTWRAAGYLNSYLSHVRLC